MKRFRTILNLLFLLTLSVGMTSCQGLIDAIAGDAGNPTTTQPTQPTTPQTPTSEEAKAEAVKLLNDAQKEGALVTIYFTLNGQDYVAYFKLVGGEYVLQEPAGTRGVIQWSNKGDLQISLKLTDLSSMGTTSITLLNFTIIDKTTGKTIMQCVIDTQNATYAAVSADNCSFGGVEVESNPVTLTEQTLEEIFGDTPVRITDDGTIEVWDGDQWVNPTKEEVEPATMTVTANGYTGTYDAQPHGITVDAPTDATIKYGTAEGTYDLTENPTYTDAGTYTVYYQVKKVGYTTVTGSATVVINKAAGTVSFSTDTVEKLNSDSAFKEEATLTGDGTISGYSSSVPGVATVAADGTVTIISTGTTVITATVTDGTNYKYSPNTATYTLTVKAGGLNAPASYGTGTNPF